MTSERAIRTNEHLLRELAPQVLAVTFRRFGDFAAAEDAVQEALLAAALQWPRCGTPDSPRAWLIQVATRRMTDHARSERSRRHREARVQHGHEHEPYIAAPDAITMPGADDSLALLFMCCHPALTRSSAIALTLRAVGGLTTAEIANAYWVPEATMAQRISRAKQSIRSSGVGFELPAGEDRAQRLEAVLHVLYLVFNEGYASSSGGALQRADLSNEAMRLTRMVHARLPEDAEVAGLLALMLLTDARRAARSGPNGELIPLDEQDRALWHRPTIDEGVALVTRAFAKRAIGPYQLQAAIAAIHDEASSVDETDWSEISALYGLLQRMTDNPMVSLNRAIAEAMVHGPEHGLELVAALESDPRLANHYRLHAVRGHLLEKTGDPRGATLAYRVAARHTASTPERNYLLMKAAQLERG